MTEEVDEHRSGTGQSVREGLALAEPLAILLSSWLSTRGRLSQDGKGFCFFLFCFIRVFKKDCTFYLCVGSGVAVSLCPATEPKLRTGSQEDWDFTQSPCMILSSVSWFYG